MINPKFFNFLGKDDEKPNLENWKEIAQTEHNLQCMTVCPIGTIYLSRYFAQELCIENLNAYHDIRSFLDYAKIPNVPVEELTDKVKKLSHYYFDSESPFEIAVSISLKKEVVEAIEQYFMDPTFKLSLLLNIFPRVQTQMLESLKGPYARFLTSDLCKEFIHQVHGKQRGDKVYQNKVDSILNANLEGVILNSAFNWTITARHPMTVVTDLLTELLKLAQVKENWILGSKGLLKFARDKLIEQRTWKNFKDSTSELSKVNLGILKIEEYMPFFVNLYNLLILDSAITTGGIPVATLSRALFVRKAKYAVGGYDFSLDEILYGVLLNNRSAWLLGKRFKNSDEKSKFICNSPATILFMIADLSPTSPKVRVYPAEKFQRQMEHATSTYILKHVKYNEKTETFTASPLFNVYLSEFKVPKFTDSDSVLRLILFQWKFLKNDKKYKLTFDVEESEGSFLCVLTSSVIKNILRKRKSIYINPDTGDKYFGELVFEMKKLSTPLPQKTGERPSLDKSIRETDVSLMDDDAYNKCRHGYGELYFSKTGDKYYGNFVNDRISGYGVYISAEYRYYGMWVDGEKEGEGVYLYNDGSVFEGNYKRGDRCGEGKMTFPTGDTISGSWFGDNIQNAVFKKGTFRDVAKISAILLKENISKFEGKLGYGVIKPTDYVSKMQIFTKVHQSSITAFREKFTFGSDFHSLRSDLTREQVDKIMERLCTDELGVMITHFVDIFHFNYASTTEADSRREKPKALDDFFDFVNQIYQNIVLFVGNEVVKFYGQNFMKSWLKNYILKWVYKPLFTLYKDIYQERDLSIKCKILSFGQATTVEFGIKPKLIPKDSEQPFFKSIQALQKITACQNATEKFDCLIESSNEMLRALDSLNLPPGSAGADDIFPISVYIFIKAKLPNLYSLFKFLGDFMDEVILDSEAAYRFTNFELAIDFIDKLDVNLKDESGVLVPVSVFEDRLEKCINKIIYEAKKQLTVPPRLLWLTSVFLECGAYPDMKQGGHFAPKSMESIAHSDYAHIEDILATVGLLLICSKKDKTFEIIYETVYPRTVYFLMASALERIIDSL